MTEVAVPGVATAAVPPAAGDEPVPDREPVEAGPLDQCQVLRCQRSATRVFLVEKHRWGLFETLVCGTHCGALRSGAPFAYNSGENVLYMGLDVDLAS